MNIQNTLDALNTLKDSFLYLNDEKYGIKGAFFLDVTADSKSTNDYIDNYRCFLKPFNFFVGR